MKTISKKLLFIVSGTILLLVIFLLFAKFLPQGQFGAIEACYSPDGINFNKQETVGNFWGGSSGILFRDGTIVLGGLDFSSRGGVKDKETGYSIKDIGLLQSHDGWKFSKFELEINDLDQTITSCGDPTFVELPEGGYRMYFTDGANGCHEKDAPLSSAYSKDGRIFSFEGEITGTPDINLEAVDFTVLYEKKSKKFYIYTRAENPAEADVLESPDGRFFTKRFKIKIPFGFQFSIIDEGSSYIAYGIHLPADSKLNSNLRYPVRAISKDGINWTRTNEQPIGPWTGDRIYCNTDGVIKMPDGYYFY